MRILFIGDIVGKGGRMAVKSLVRGLLREYNCQFCIANGENMAGGGGFTKQCLNELTDCGVDVFTAGDHVWDQKEFPNEITQFGNVLRPANFSSRQPGRGFGVFETADGLKVGVLNLIGRTFVAAQSNCPFEAADVAIPELRRETPIVIVDFHAEATSEKIALGRYLDGRVSAVIGTHTHVPTADQQLFPNGTAFQCDAGMVGARDSIIGRDIQAVLQKFSTGMPARFTVCEKDIRLCGTVITIDEATGKATSIERVLRDLP
ncbi:MAG: TIGR00282 family metallophosphoesterase [Victivallales bacterium]|nr:TIGR00282 family metallophosphoesterase [Victivallales bacterium]